MNEFRANLAFRTYSFTENTLKKKSLNEAAGLKSDFLGLVISLLYNDQ